jgi:transcriptional regulator with XRE-family HTH domain
MDNRNIFAENLRKYMALSGKSRRDVCEALDLGYSTFSEWINGNKYPRMDKVEKLANYFGILKSDLIEEKTETNPLYYRGTIEGIIGKDAELLEMIQKYLKLDDKNKKAVKQMIDNLSE